jgi:hypothetical protein
LGDPVGALGFLGCELAVLGLLVLQP